MLKQGDVTSKTVSFIIKGFVHDLYFYGHKKIKQVDITAYKIQVTNGLPVRDNKGIPIQDPDVAAQQTTSNNDGYYEIVFLGVPIGVYCINVTENKPNPKYDSKRNYINIVESTTYNQDIILIDTIKGQKIENDPKRVSIHEIFMLE